MAKAQAASQKRRWFPFEDRLDGWMVERRARGIGKPIKCDIYYHHKSGCDFKSTRVVVKFLLFNMYQKPKSKQQNFGPRPVRNYGPTTSQKVALSKGKRPLETKSTLVSGAPRTGFKEEPTLSLASPVLALEAPRPKRRKAKPSDSSSSRRPVSGAQRPGGMDFEQGPTPPRPERKYAKRVVPSDPSTSKRPRKNNKKRTDVSRDEIEDLGLFMNFIGQDVLLWTARMELETYNQTTTSAPEPNIVVADDVDPEPRVRATEEEEPIVSTNVEIANLDAKPDAAESTDFSHVEELVDEEVNRLVDPTIDAALVTTTTEDQLAAEVMNRFVDPTDVIDSFEDAMRQRGWFFEPKEADPVLPNDAPVPESWFV
ncbi:hypothetical protein LINPERPRIM_LOCUS22887, partial [Linum perenne]